MSARNVRVVSIAAIALIFLSTPAYAYLDPGTGTMLLQGIIAAFAATAAVISMKFAQLKQFAQKLRKKKSPPAPVKSDTTDADPI